MRAAQVNLVADPAPDATGARARLRGPARGRGGALAVLALLLVRPAAGAAALIGLHRTPWRDRAAIGFYGIRGIATFYYLAYALEQTEFPGKEELWATAALVVLLSIFIHGLTAAPVITRLDMHRERKQDALVGEGQA